ncbi:MAG: acyl-CoA dehydrogenase family protein [Syntrophales bacterium]|jgi:hypothetical protein
MSVLNRYYTEEHQIFRESIRRFYEKEVTPHIEDWRKEGIGSTYRLVRRLSLQSRITNYLLTGLACPYEILIFLLLKAKKASEALEKMIFNALHTSLNDLYASSSY